MSDRGRPTTWTIYVCERDDCEYDASRDLTAAPPLERPWCPARPGRGQHKLTAVVVAPVSELEQAREALKPFAALADEADELGHGEGSTCPWRLAYVDLAAARAALAPGVGREEQDE